MKFTGHERDTYAGSGIDYMLPNCTPGRAWQ